jgi:hypothetical protein
MVPAFADLDNNGTMDLVINNINDEAFVYRNTSGEKKDSTNHFLQIAFKGDDKNIAGIGSWADIYYRGVHQVYEHNPYRGYLSSIQPVAHFGIGSVSIIDSVVIRWPNGKKQRLEKVKTDQILKVDIADAKENYYWPRQSANDNSLFREITKTSGINYMHKDFELVDFNIQVTLPHKLSEYCPAFAVADLDGNGLEDILLGGNSDIHSQIFLQQKNGEFLQRDFCADSSTVSYKDAGILLFDANGDGSQDIYMASGGFKYKKNSPNYQDRIYVNDGKVNFPLQQMLFRLITQASCV